jgi:hypothetical protein
MQGSTAELGETPRSRQCRPSQTWTSPDFSLVFGRPKTFTFELAVRRSRELLESSLQGETSKEVSDSFVSRLPASFVGTPLFPVGLCCQYNCKLSAAASHRRERRERDKWRESSSSEAQNLLRRSGCSLDSTPSRSIRRAIGSSQVLAMESGRSFFFDHESTKDKLFVRTIDPLELQYI